MAHRWRIEEGGDIVLRISAVDALQLSEILDLADQGLNDIPWGRNVIELSETIQRFKEFIRPEAVPGKYILHRSQDSQID